MKSHPSWWCQAHWSYYHFTLNKHRLSSNPYLLLIHRLSLTICYNKSSNPTRIKMNLFCIIFAKKNIKASTPHRVDLFGMSCTLNSLGARNVNYTWFFIESLARKSFRGVMFANRNVNWPNKSWEGRVVRSISTDSWNWLGQTVLRWLLTLLDIAGQLPNCSKEFGGRSVTVPEPNAVIHPPAVVNRHQVLKRVRLKGRLHLRQEFSLIS